MTKLVSTNPVLLIQVKRWVDIDQIMHKNHTPVDFQRSIDITVDGLHIPVTYHIQGIVCHRGDSTHAGHFYSYVKHGSQWFQCDDANVSVVEFSSVTSEQATV